LATHGFHPIVLLDRSSSLAGVLPDKDVANGCTQAISRFYQLHMLSGISLCGTANP
jgi:hypothetical protein